MVAASWYFHQLLDGMNTEENIPLVVLSLVSVSEARLVAQDNRYQVTIAVEFCDQKYLSGYQAPTETGASLLVAGLWQTCVFVKDKDIFKKRIGWKEADTRKKWKKHREWLAGSHD
eukprot:scaffold238779_cov60-Attheya_sp.AAC.3